MLALLIAFSTALFSSAQPAGCLFIRRQDAQALMRDRPDEVIGYASCYELDPNLGSFTVARFSAAKDRTLQEFLLKLAKQNVPDAVETVIVGEEKSASGARQLMIRSKRNNGKYDWDYAFTAKGSGGAEFVFVHSGNSDETLTGEKSLKNIRNLLSGPEFIAELERGLALTKK
jgi:hypothetical protein